MPRKSTTTKEKNSLVKTLPVMELSLVPHSSQRKA
jgi:hypothetical protein